MPCAAEFLGSSLERVADIGGGSGELVGLEIEAGEDKVGGGVGLEVEGALGFGAGVDGLPLCSRTWARPAWAAALVGSAAMAAWNSCSASGMRPWAR